MPHSNSDSGMPSPAPHPKKRLCPFPLLLSTLFPVLAAVLVYQLDPFDPAPLPIHELGQAAMSVSFATIACCKDGWIKRVRLHHADSAVEKWVNTHGRPLGVALGHNGEAIVADGYKGLLNISRDGEVEVLTEEADGLKFKLADGVDVADNGMIYFDASYKYSMEDSVWDVLEGKPHGRLMSFDPVTRKTRVLSPIFTLLMERRCRQYYIESNKQGELEKFVDNLTGLPDNIKYDGEGHYWIALATGNSVVLDLALRYAFIRKAMGLMEKYIGGLSKGKNAGVLVVDLEGKPVAHYYDHKLC
ncbi:hypothetical protein Gogos_005978 [Gossypium gossypioides]|uniref:Strictosidine synthase conserved region domain-containing protein n=1 Tax=Gossypium gossypioides TaxID=34282 RepID=A0A7J9C4K0_GOSGO|nr:hypothetical protein [Gossypium gossypioides]